MLLVKAIPSRTKVTGEFANMLDDDKRDDGVYTQSRPASRLEVPKACTLQESFEAIAYRRSSCFPNPDHKQSASELGSTATPSRPVSLTDDGCKEPVGSCDNSVEIMPKASSSTPRLKCSSIGAENLQAAASTTTSDQARIYEVFGSATLPNSSLASLSSGLESHLAHTSSNPNEGLLWEEADEVESVMTIPNVRLDNDDTPQADSGHTHFPCIGAEYGAIEAMARATLQVCGGVDSEHQAHHIESLARTLNDVLTEFQNAEVEITSLTAEVQELKALSRVSRGELLNDLQQLRLHNAKEVDWLKRAHVTPAVLPVEPKFGSESQPNDFGGKEFRIFEEELVVGIHAESLHKPLEALEVPCVEETNFLRDSIVPTLHQDGNQAFQCSPPSRGEMQHRRDVSPCEDEELLDVSKDFEGMVPEIQWLCAECKGFEKACETATAHVQQLRTRLSKQTFKQCDENCLEKGKCGTEAVLAFPEKPQLFCEGLEQVMSLHLMSAQRLYALITMINGKNQVSGTLGEESWQGGCTDTHISETQTISDPSFTRRKLPKATDSKPALKKHHSVRKLEAKDFVRKEVAKLDAATNSKLESKNFLAKEVAEDILSDAFEFEKLFPVSGHRKYSKVSPQPVTQRELHVSADDKPDLQVGDERVLGSDELTERERTDKTLKTEDNHRLTRKLESESFVQKEAAKQNVSFPVCGHRKPYKISPDGTISDNYGDIVTGRDGLPVTKDEVVLSPSGGFLLCSAGHLVLRHELQVGGDGLLLGPDDLPVMEMQQTYKMLKTDDLLLKCNRIPFISKDGLLVVKTSIMRVGGISIPVGDLTISSDGVFHGPDDELIIGDDGLVLTEGDVLIRHDEKPFLTLEGKPILQCDLV